MNKYDEKIRGKVSPDTFLNESENKLVNCVIRSEKEAYQLYCDYTHAMGFSVRKGK